MLTELLPQNIARCNVDIWFQDETRVGQQGSLTRIWAKRGTRPRKVRQQQFIVPNLGEKPRTCSASFQHIKWGNAIL